MILEADENH